MKVWDAATGQEILTLKGHTDLSSERGVQPRRQAARLRQSTIRTVKVWDAATGQETLTLKGHTGMVTERGVQPDGKRLASAGLTQTVKVWDAATGQETLTLKGHAGDCHERGVQPRRQAARLRRLGRDGEGVGRRDRPGNPHPQGAHRAVSRAWRSAPTASGSPPPAAIGTVKVWDAATGQETLTLKGHTGAVDERGVQPGRQAARLRQSRIRTVKVWDAATGQETLTLKGHTAAVTERGVQPGRPAARLRKSGWDGEGVGRRDRAGNPHPQGAHRPGLRAWRSAPTASGSPPPVGTRR